MEHAFDNVCDEIDYTVDPKAFNAKLTEPMFIGQGCSQSIGSDTYGSYIVSKKQIGGKTIWSLAPAKTHFISDWTSGSQICDGPAHWNASEWIVKWGKSWWYCDEEGKRYNGRKCRLNFRGAHSYRDPSF